MIPFLAVGTAAALSLLCYLSTRGESRRLPPGPKPHFLLGNLLDFPAHFGWLKYAEWKKQYGDVIHLNVMGQHIIILNSLQATIDLLDKRSSIYSSRPVSIMLHELVGWGYSFPLMPYSARWRTFRRLFHGYFHEKKAQDYHASQESNAQTFARNLLREPSKFLDHIRLAFASIMLDVMYDIKVEDRNHIYVKTAEVAMAGAVAASVPGNFLVDLIPFLKHVPAWFPGAGFQKKAAVWRAATRILRTMPTDVVRECMVNGKGSRSIMASMLNTSDEVKKLYERDLNNESFDDMAMSIGAASFAAGSDSTIAITQAFLFAMAKFPEAQKTAQAELDRVTGRKRLPTFQDRNSVPYLNSLIKEVMRWHPAAPLGLPHTTSEDDEYNGMFIPKGSVVLSNVWAISHDPTVYSNPEAFDPSRWLSADSTRLKLDDQEYVDPATIPYGFGRRICPGRHFANASLFITAATVLSCFDISPPLDASGKPVELRGEVNGELLLALLPFDLTITPRSEEVIKLINETAL